EDDGQFYFKLNAADGGLLLQSRGFAQGREAGQWVARLKREGTAALAEAPVERAAGLAAGALEQALDALAAAAAAE
ncbi:tryptophan--tRNA ligase, partial [Paucibacter sp. XJ19-41]|nr:tryptophan--tRNA ligase [Paucibacter sp. XJ19-41]